MLYFFYQKEKIIMHDNPSIRMDDLLNDDSFIQEDIFLNIQRILADPPLIIWGSGATISFGLPSMNDLNEELKQQLPSFNQKNDNLEAELSKQQYESSLEEIKNIIWQKINEADKKVLEKIASNNNDEFEGIRLMISTFTKPFPKLLNIVTTNYDRVLEYVMSYHNFNYTDGFDGKRLSRFYRENFRDKNMINLIKVHGSLNWFDVNDETRFLNDPINDEKPKIIPPSQGKYRETHESLYRDLLQISDDKIRAAKSFLVVGFGFNDEHLTPHIKNAVREGIPIIVITKKILDSTHKELRHAKEYFFLEESNGKTLVTYKIRGKSETKKHTLEGNLWQLQEFMGIL